MNRVDEEINKPAKGVLVHGINVCQVCNTEEQHRRMLCNWSIAFSRFSYFKLRFLCNLHINSNFKFVCLFVFPKDNLPVLWNKNVPTK